MRKFIAAFAVALVALAMAAAAGATTITVNANADTYVDSANPTTNYSTSSVFRTDRDSTSPFDVLKRTYITFADLTAAGVPLNNYTVNSVSICLYAETAWNPAGTPSVGYWQWGQQASQSNYGSMTWNNQPGPGSFPGNFTVPMVKWSAAGYQCATYTSASYTQAQLKTRVDTLRLQQDGGLFIEPANQSFSTQAVRWTSSEGSNPPYVTVDFTTP